MEGQNTEQYVLTQDTQSLTDRILEMSGAESTPALECAVGIYYKELVEATRIVYPDIEITEYQEEIIEKELGTAVSTAMLETSDACCICLDRFLLRQLEKSVQEGRFFRLEMTRTVDGKKRARQGSVPIEEQVRQIANQVNGRKVILVDDGIFTGGTVKEATRLLDEQGIGVAKVIGYIGNGETAKVQEELGIPIQTVKNIRNLLEWIDIRDFGVWGGRQFRASTQNRVTSAIPYIAPWSDGSGASFADKEGFLAASVKMIESQIKLIAAIEATTRRSLTFRDLVKAGFPLPTDERKTIPVSINQRAAEYLESCLKELSGKVVVLDMDGTIYQLDGEGNGYIGSTLEKKVNERALEFIRVNEPEVDYLDSTAVFANGLRDDVGLSAYLSQRYGITREEYFAYAWDLDPKGIVQNFEEAVTAIKEYKKENPYVKLILLTGAPDVWQKRVIEYLGLTDYFDLTFTAADYRTKLEIFQFMRQRYKPANVTSIGDQESTDIAPALAEGFQGILVDGPGAVKGALLRLSERDI